MLRAIVVHEIDDDGSNCHSQFTDFPREDGCVQPETSTQQSNNNKKKKTKKMNPSDYVKRETPQNTENMEDQLITIANTEKIMEISREDVRRKKRSNKRRIHKNKKQVQGGNVIEDVPHHTEINMEAHNTNAQPLIDGSVTEKTNEEDRLWSDLIPDLVSDILHKLSYVDRIAATCAIPNWRYTVEKPIGPCLISFADDYKTYTISSMLNDFTTTITNPDLPANFQILSSKHGWLLLMEDFDTMTYSMFFYNPISKVTIKLPPFNRPHWYHFSFSAPPDSPNCVVIAAFFWDNLKRILICEKGHDEWIMIDDGYMENYEKFIVDYMSPIFYRGRFYWIGVDGRVGEFDILTRSWAIHGKDMRLWPSTFRFYLVESDDDVFSIWSTREGDAVRIYKLDLSNNTDIWKETYNLGGRCFFVGLKASVSLDTRVLSCKEEKIYFQMVDQAKELVYYSGETRKMHPYGNFMGCTEFFFNYCWMEPQWVEPKCDQELRWF